MTIQSQPQPQDQDQEQDHHDTTHSSQCQPQSHSQSPNSSSSSSTQSARWLASLLSHAGLSTSPHNHHSSKGGNQQDSWDAHWLPNYASRRWNSRESSPPSARQPGNLDDDDEDDDDEINLEAELDLLQDSDNEYEYDEEEEGKDSIMEEKEVREQQEEEARARFESDRNSSPVRKPLNTSSATRSVTFNLTPSSNSLNHSQGRNRSSTTTTVEPFLLEPPPSKSVYNTRRKPRSSSSVLTHKRSISEGDQETLQFLRNHYNRGNGGHGRLRSNTIAPAQPLSINTFLPVRMVPSSTQSRLDQDKENDPVKAVPSASSSSPIRPKVLDPVPPPVFSSQVTSSSQFQNLPLSLKLDLISGSSGDPLLPMTRSSSLSDGSCHGDVGDLDPEGQLERSLSDIGSSSCNRTSQSSSDSGSANSNLINSDPSEGGLKITTSGLPLSGTMDSPNSGPSTPIPNSNSKPLTSTSTFSKSRPHYTRSNSHRSRSRFSQNHRSEPITESQIRAHAGPFISQVVDTFFSGAESGASRISGRSRSGTEVSDRRHHVEMNVSSSELQARQRSFTASAPRGRAPVLTTSSVSTSNGPHSLNGFSHRFVTRLSNSNYSSRSSSLERRTIKGRSSSPSPSQDSFSSVSVSSMDTVKTTSESEASTCPSLSSSMSSSPSSTAGQNPHESGTTNATSSGYISGLTKGISLSRTLSRAYHSLPIPSLFSSETDSQLLKLERDCSLSDSPTGLDRYEGRKKDRLEEGLTNLANDHLHTLTKDYSDEEERVDDEKMNRAVDRSSIKTINSQRRNDLSFSPSGKYPFASNSTGSYHSRHSQSKYSNMAHVSPLWREDQVDDDEDEWEEMTDDSRSIRIRQ